MRPLAKSPPRFAPALLSLVVILVLVALTWLRFAPPAPVGADAPADRFSAVRARVVLAELLGHGAPHPMGSRANEAVRRRLIEAFERLGLRVEEHGDREVVSAGVLARPRSVVARLPGREPGRKAILLTAHHDSVGAGPGASDDGAGVAAIVETARALKAGTPLRRTVIFAITDGSSP